MKIVNKERLSTIGNVVKEYSKVLGPLVGYAIFSQRGAIINAIDELRYSGNVKYDDAVKVIMDSDMIAAYKTNILKILKRDQDSEYYKTIIHIVKSDVIAAYKVDMISEINKEK